MTALDFCAANQAYEAWLRAQTPAAERSPIFDAHLQEKHKKLSRSLFSFLRGTYFRWAQIAATLDPTLMTAPRVLCVGDVHLENYGTWWDWDKKPVWGVNDLDEAVDAPYVWDLARLTVSARVAAPDLPAAAAARQAAVILDGYRRGLTQPQPFRLSDAPKELTALVEISAKSARKDFEEDAEAATDLTPPPAIRQIFEALLQEKDATLKRYATWVKGNGSLGRPKYVLIARKNSDKELLVYEAKAAVPSGWLWARPQDAPPPGAPSAIHRFLTYPGRAQDPSQRRIGGFFYRRLRPETRKLIFDPASDAAETLLQLMGRELGGLHAATAAAAPAVAAHLDQAAPGWLDRLAHEAEQRLRADFTAWTQRRSAP